MDNPTIPPPMPPRQMSFTRDDRRAKVLEAIKHAIWTTKHGYDGGEAQALAVLDSLHGLACFVPPEPTEEMLDAGVALSIKLWRDNGGFIASGAREMFASVIATIIATGDLANQPETKTP